MGSEQTVSDPLQNGSPTPHLKNKNQQRCEGRDVLCSRRNPSTVLSIQYDAGRNHQQLEFTTVTNSFQFSNPVAVLKWVYNSSTSQRAR